MSCDTRKFKKIILKFRVGNLEFFDPYDFKLRTATDIDFIIIIIFLMRWSLNWIKGNSPSTPYGQAEPSYVSIKLRYRCPSFSFFAVICSKEQLITVYNKEPIHGVWTDHGH